MNKTEEDLLLLHNLGKLVVKEKNYNPLFYGTEPMQRKLKSYVNNGVIHIDKPSNPSSHEVVTWVKTLLEVKKTGHAGTLDPRVSGCLTICIGRSTRLVKTQSDLGKVYVCEITFDSAINIGSFKAACLKFTGTLYQRPPLMCAVKRSIRLRKIQHIDILEVSECRALFKVSCEAGTYIRTLCTHLGLFLGVPAQMSALRRVRSGITNESNCFTLHDLKDAIYLYDTMNDESMLRRIIRPLESLLVNYKRIFIKDSAVNAICYGAKLTVKGIISYDSHINTGDKIVIVSMKGEAVAIATASLSAFQLSAATTGIVANTTRVIMKKDIYPILWGDRVLIEQVG